MNHSSPRAMSGTGSSSMSAQESMIYGRSGTMEPIHRAVLSELGVGKFHSLSRDELRLRVGYWVDREVSDRELRGAIEWLRANHPQGGWIISDSAWQGYWFGESLEEVKEHCRVTRNTAYKR